jgi:hypothetical protein
MAAPHAHRGDEAFVSAYWKAFNRFFGPANGPVVRAMLLTRFERGDSSNGEIDRVCYGLRQTMGWIAEAIERAALADLGVSTQSTTEARPPAVRSTGS